MAAFNLSLAVAIVLLGIKVIPKLEKVSNILIFDQAPDML